MKNTIKATVLAAAISMSIGCSSVDYNKIPLESGEIPYILAPGVYTDIHGIQHHNQTNIWAMPQADVFDYMRYIRGVNEPRQEAKEAKESSGIGWLWKIVSALIGGIIGALITIPIVKHKNK